VRRFLRPALYGILSLFVIIQAVPYGRSHPNPPVTGEPDWDSPRTRRLVERACFDCHSNEVEWPWYTFVAPFSWLSESNVASGRDAVNYSEWNTPQEEVDESAQTVRDGEMPPWDYTLLHSDARLSDQEKDDLIDGLVATLGDEDES